MSRYREGTKIPVLLNRRYDLFVQLEEARFLLENLSRQDDTEDERMYLQQKVDTLEKDLRDSEEEATQMINQMPGSHTARAAASLHFLKGYKWEVAGRKLGVSKDVARQSVYSAFEKTAEKAGDHEAE